MQEQGVTIEVELVPVVNYAMQQNGMPIERLEVYSTIGNARQQFDSLPQKCAILNPSYESKEERSHGKQTRIFQ